MEFQELSAGNFFKPTRALTDEEKTALMELYKTQFDPVEAEKEYRDLIEKGGVSWEELLQKLDEIDQKIQPRSP